MTEPSFQVFEDGEGDWRWRLVDRDGTVIARTSSTHPSRDSCIEHIDGVRALAGDAPVAPADRPSNRDDR